MQHIKQQHMVYRPFIVLLVATSSLFSQTTYKPTRAVLPASVAFVSGMSNGLNQTLQHHYNSFERRFPNSDPNFWNPDVSWRNKYAGGLPENGERFPGSKTVFVFTTDAFHLTNTIHRTALFSAGCLVTIGEKRPWWHYALDIGITYTAHTAGFHLVYSVAFK